MIVECPSCSTKYRVREDKLPEGGGNIRCPHCQHVFFVKPPTAQASEGGGLRKMAGGGAPMGEELPTRVGTAPAMLVPGGLAAAPAVAAPPVAAPATPSAPSAEDLEKSSWKLKTSFGLVYDFPDSDSLRKWLSARDDLSGYTLSHDGAVFQELTAYAKVLPENLLQRYRNPAPSLSMPATPRQPPTKNVTSTTPAVAGPGATGPSPKKTASGGPATGRMEAVPSTNSAPARGARDAKGGSGKDAKKGPRGMLPPPEEPKAAWWILPVGGTVALVVVLFLLQLVGLIDVRAIMAGGGDEEEGELTNAPRVFEAPQGGGERPLVPQGGGEAGGPAAPSGTTGSGAVAPSPFRSSDHLKILLEQAQEEMRKREYPKALDTLRSAQVVAPNDPQVYELLSEAYDRSGDRQASREAREKARALAEKQAPPQ